MRTGLCRKRTKKKQQTDWQERTDLQTQWKEKLQKSPLSVDGKQVPAGSEEAVKNIDMVIVRHYHS